MTRGMHVVIEGRSTVLEDMCPICVGLPLAARASACEGRSTYHSRWFPTASRLLEGNPKQGACTFPCLVQGRLRLRCKGTVCR
jgi:hypothetical protein